jgi:hypothetical protein
VAGLSAGPSSQAASVAMQEGDGSPSRPGSQDTTGGSAEAQAVTAMNELGNAGQTFQPNGETDAEAQSILDSGATQDWVQSLMAPPSDQQGPPPEEPQ